MKKQRIFAFLMSALLLGTTGCAGTAPDAVSSSAPTVEKTTQEEPPQKEDQEEDFDWEKAEAQDKQLKAEAEEREKRLMAISEDSLGGFSTFSLRSAPLLLAQEGENRVCSSLSLHLALSMLAETTDGDTRAEILQTLGLSDINASRQLTGGLFDALTFDNEVGKLTLANSLWLSQSYPFREGFTKTLEEHYRAESFAFDHTNPADGQRISDWIAQNTGGKLSPDPFELNEQSLAFLINAIYYKDQWTDQMEPRQTAPAPFRLSDGSEVTCDFMYGGGRMYFAEGDGFTKVTKEFRNGGAMSFILPAVGSTPGALLADEAKLSAALGAKQEMQHVNLTLPKFDFQTSLDLNEAVKALGIKLAFDGERSDFTPLTGVKPVYVSKIEQGAAVTVDENGCEAAAYTSISAIATGVILDPKEVKLDRPFLFTVEGPRREEEVSGPLLFLGVVENPVK